MVGLYVTLFCLEWVKKNLAFCYFHFVLYFSEYPIDVLIRDLLHCSYCNFYLITSLKVQYVI